MFICCSFSLFYKCFIYSHERLSPSPHFSFPRLHKLDLQSRHSAQLSPFPAPLRIILPSLSRLRIAESTSWLRSHCDIASKLLAPRILIFAQGVTSSLGIEPLTHALFCNVELFVPCQHRSIWNYDTHPHFTLLAHRQLGVNLRTLPAPRPRA